MMTRREEKKRISTTKISKFQNFKKINEKKNKNKLNTAKSKQPFSPMFHLDHCLFGSL